MIAKDRQTPKNERLSLKGFNRTQGDMAGTGLLVEDAGYAARRAFGNTTLVKEEVCEMWGWR